MYPRTQQQEKPIDGHGCRLYAAKVKCRNGRPMPDEGVVAQNAANRGHTSATAGFQARRLVQPGGLKQALPLDLVHWRALRGAVPGLGLSEAVLRQTNRYLSCTQALPRRF